MKNLYWLNENLNEELVIIKKHWGFNKITSSDVVKHSKPLDTSKKSKDRKIYIRELFQAFSCLREIKEFLKQDNNNILLIDYEALKTLNENRSKYDV